MSDTTWLIGFSSHQPYFVHQVNASETHRGAYHTHQCTAGYEARSQQSALFSTCRINRFVLATGGDVPVDGTAYNKRQVQFQGDKHT